MPSGGLARSSTGDATDSSSVFLAPVSISVTGRPPPRKRAISSIGRWVAERPMRTGGVVGQRLQPLQAEREMDAALVGRDGVNLVDDHPAHGAQRLSRARGEHQVERFRSGDQDVRRVAHPAAPARWAACRRSAARR